MGRARLAGAALALALTAALLALAPLPAPEELSLGWLGGALLCSLGVWLLRALRLWAHIASLPAPLPAPLTLRAALRVSAAHTLLARLAPLRLGELGLPYLLAREGVSVAEGATFLLRARILELWLLGAGALGALALLGAGAREVSPLAYAALAALPLLSLLLTPLVTPALRLAARLAARLAGLLARAHPSGGALTRAAEALARAAEGEGAAPLTPARAALLAALSALILCIQALMFGCFARACSPHPLTLPALWLAAAGAHLGGAAPLPTPGGVGGHEAGWVAGFTAVGLPLPAAVLSAVLSQWVTLAFAGGWWLLSRGWGAAARRGVDTPL